MIRVIVLLGLMIFSNHLFSQCESERYKDSIFSTIYVHSDVKYGEAPGWTFPHGNVELFADIHEPIGDPLSKRPLMIWAHPGGFLIGNKNVDDMVALCDTFAKKGYVTATVSYRLGYNPFDNQSAERAVYRGTQDVRAAVRYFIEFADIYDIDTSRIFIGGSSAGAFAALHTAYLDENERPLSTYGGTGYPALGCLDCTGNPYQHQVLPLAIVDMWGGLGHPSFRDADDTIPVLIMHGTADNIVSYYTGSPFDLDFLPVSYGADPITKRSDTLGVPYTLHTFYGENHEPHGVSNGDFTGPPTPYWDTILTNVTNFYHSFLIPETSDIFGPDTSMVAALDLYGINYTSGSTYCWTATGGTIQEYRDSSIVVEWQTPGTGTITVQELNEIDASGLLKTFDVFVDQISNVSLDEPQEELTIYPNPVSDVLSLNIDRWQAANVIIQGITGMQYYQGEIKERIDVSHMPVGLYLLVVEHEGERFVRRFVVQ